MEMLKNFHIENVGLHILNAVILFAILRFLVYKPLHKFMQARAERIAASMEVVRQAQSQAQQTRREAELALEQAVEDARARAMEITGAADESARAMTRRAREEAASIVEKARAQTKAEHDSAMEGLRGEMIDLAAGMAEQLLRQGGGSP